MSERVCRVEGPLSHWVGKDGFNLRSEDEATAIMMIEEGADTHTVTGKEQLLFACIPNGHAKLAIKICKHLGAFFFVEVQEDFGICVGIELVTTCFQVGTKFNVIEDFSVVNDPEGLVFIVDRLITTGKVNDAESSGCKTGDVIHVDAEGIWATVPDQAKHTTEETFVRALAAKINYSCYSTHILVYRVC